MPAKPQLSRLRRFWRASLIWLVVVAAAFLAGVLTYHSLRYKPLTETLAQTQGKLVQAHQTTTDLQTKTDGLNTQLAAAKDQVAALESDKEALQSELDNANTHLELLQVLVDTSNARLALVNGNVPAAKVALENTSQLLESLAPRIAAVDANLAGSMPQRLALILSGLDNDTETAKVDLELLTGNLLDVEAALFSK
jgi:peptidoglycan hydrolase CwlO-like protein